MTETVIKIKINHGAALKNKIQADLALKMATFHTRRVSLKLKR